MYSAARTFLLFIAPTGRQFGAAKLAPGQWAISINRLGRSKNSIFGSIARAQRGIFRLFSQQGAQNGPPVVVKKGGSGAPLQKSQKSTQISSNPKGRPLGRFILIVFSKNLTASPSDDGASRGWPLIARPGDSTALARPSPLRRGPRHA